MKKIIAYLIIAAAICACSSDDDSKLYSVLANVTFDGASASPSVVYMYDYDSAKDFDKSYDAVCKFGDTRTLYNASGAAISPAYSSPSTSGVNTFEDVKAGKYVLVAMYKPSGYSFSNFYYYGYAELSLDHNLQSVTFKFLSSSKRGEFIKF